MPIDIMTAPVSIIRIDSLLDAAQALAAEGYMEHAAKLIGQARAGLAKLAAGTPETGDDEPAGGEPVMIYSGPGRYRFACQVCKATVFTRSGDEFACNGCGSCYRQVIAA